MPAKLYVVHGSHPCNTVARALELKGIAYKKVEFPPPMHVPLQKMRFGSRTVPGIVFEDGEKVHGSRAILARIDELVPDPPLLPSEPEAREAVLEAERWGEEVLQPIGRRILWLTLNANPGAAPSFGEGGQVKLPGFMVRASMPLISRVELRMNAATPEAMAADLQALPGYLDKIDGWLAEGLLGGETPNRADLQIAPTLCLLMTMADLRAIIAPRPAGAWAQRLYPDVAGSVPAGAIPSELLPSPA